MSPLNQRRTYSQTAGLQANKDVSLAQAMKLVHTIRDEITPHIKICTFYEPNNNLRLTGAPAVLLPNGALAIAPDLRCVTNSGRTFWIEVKDKSQRFWHPDTGADIHQVLGWYEINTLLREPVLLVFQDPPLDECHVLGAPPEATSAFDARWERFSGRPYGNWLQYSLSPNNYHYPQIYYDEHSRDIAMDILYFDIRTMRPLRDWKNIIARMPSKTPASLVVYRKNGNYFETLTLSDLQSRKVATDTI